MENRVAFQFCDPLGVAWHGRYFEWLEQARTELFRSVGLPVPTIKGMGFKMFIVDARCRYMVPMTYDETVRVTAWFTASSPLIRVAYDIYNVDRDRRSARAFTVLATTDVAGNLLTKTPDGLLERLPIR
ncbi:MAG: acyl-CoA thioesterase [Planctomycetes bacterium]|nr:acyl-CoA thioesterase [Planctomycetota bacterium]